MRDRLSLTLASNSVFTHGLHWVQATAGEHNWPPQKSSLACGFFWGENNRGPNDSGRMLDLLPNCLKNRDRGPLARREPSPQVTTYSTSQVCGHRTALLRLLSVSRVCTRPSDHSFIKHLPFPSLCQLPSSPLRSQTTTHNILSRL